MSVDEDIRLPLHLHLEELRRRLIYCVIPVLIWGGMIYFLRHQIVATLSTFASVSRLTYLHPGEAFFAYLNLAAGGGVILSAPWIIFQLWKFILPGLKSREEHYLRRAFLTGGIGFYAGLTVGLLLLAPALLQTLNNFSYPLLTANFTITHYLSFLLVVSFTVGLALQLPIIIVLLTRTGLVSYSFLQKHRKTAIVTSIFVAGLLTPSGVLSQVLMGLLLYFFYEGSIVLTQLLTILE